MTNYSSTVPFPSPCETNTLSLSFSSSALWYYLGISILASLMTGVTMILNSTFLATILSQRRLRTSLSNKLLTILSIVDLLQGILTWPLVAANSIIYSRGETNCLLIDIFYIIAYYPVGTTMTTIFLVTLEQYFAILHPYLYISHVTFYRLVSPAIVFICLVLMIDIIGVIKWDLAWMDDRKTLFAALAITIVMALVYMHTKIVRCASQVAAKITETNRVEGKQIKSRAKAAKSGFIILVATLMCYCPNMGYVIYTQVRTPTPTDTTFIQIPTEIFGLFSSIVDPAVFYWRLGILRKATKEMLASSCKFKNRVECVAEHTCNS